MKYNKEVLWLTDYIRENNIKWVVDEAKTLMEVHDNLVKVKNSVGFNLYCISRHFKLIVNEIVVKLGLPK